MQPFYYDPYTEGLYRIIRNAIRPGKLIRHHQTCPVCGRTLVNTYLRDGVWKCKKCWDEETDKKVETEE